MNRSREHAKRSRRRIAPGCRALGDQKTCAIVFAIAMLGRSGLDINAPSKRYTLNSLPGTFSGLHLVSLMYTGMKRIEPNTDAGIDLSKEFEAAVKLFDDPRRSTGV